MHGCTYGNNDADPWCATEVRTEEAGWSASKLNYEGTNDPGFLAPYQVITETCTDECTGMDNFLHFTCEYKYGMEA